MLLIFILERAQREKNIQRRGEKEKEREKYNLYFDIRESFRSYREQIVTYAGLTLSVQYKNVNIDCVFYNNQVLHRHCYIMKKVRGRRGRRTFPFWTPTFNV